MENVLPIRTIDLSRYSTLSAERPASSVSDKYGFVPTTRVLNVLADYGWMPSKVSQSSTRVEERNGFQKHVVRLQNENMLQVLGESAKEYRPEIIVTNSHDATSAFQLSLGIWRLVCSNGLCASEENGLEKIRHIGFAESLVESAVMRLAAQAPKMIECAEGFRKVVLNHDEAIAYSKAAIELKFDGDSFTIDPERALFARRYTDKASDLWSTYNRVQENLIKGGLRGRGKEGQRRTDRAVKSIDRDIKLNRALWTLTEEMAKLKNLHN